MECLLAVRILIVETDTACLHLMAGLLAARGHTPLTTRAAPIDLVLCGLAPGADPARVARELRSDPLLAARALLAVTSMDGMAAAAAGFDGYIARPIEPESFAAEVEAFLPAGAAVTGTVLVVDDDAFMLEILADFLGQEGYRILTAASGPAALEVLAREQVDVILSDQWMPDMCGVDLMARAAQLYPGTARLILSGHAETGEIERAVAAGTVDRFYTKPWSGAVLRDGMREAFHLRQRRAALAGPRSLPPHAR